MRYFRRGHARLLLSKATREFSLRSIIGVVSLEKFEIRAIVNISVMLDGVTYDPTNDQLYFSGRSPSIGGNGRESYIYRVSTTTHLNDYKIVFSTTEYNVISGLAFDWIANNLYAVSQNGFVFACKAFKHGPLKCLTLLSGQGVLKGIAVDPNTGMMYWTEKDPAGIVRAHMDGSNVTKLIVSGVRDPTGIAVDYASSRIFWTDCDTQKVQSSDLEGFNITTIIYYDVGSTCPWGVAMHDRIAYWTNWYAKTIASSDKSGYVSTLYNGSLEMEHITLGTVPEKLPKTRQNDCDGQHCASLCILIPKSFRCFD